MREGQEGSRTRWGDHWRQYLTVSTNRVHSQEQDELAVVAHASGREQVMGDVTYNTTSGVISARVAVVDNSEIVWLVQDPQGAERLADQLEDVVEKLREAAAVEGAITD